VVLVVLMMLLGRVPYLTVVALMVGYLTC